jgi:phage-related protein
VSEWWCNKLHPTAVMSSGVRSEKLFGRGLFLTETDMCVTVLHCFMSLVCG